MNDQEEEEEEEIEDEEEDIEEVKDSSSDSDIMEVDADDPVDPLTTNMSMNNHGKSGKTNVVTIDDMKTLKALADSAKANKQQQNEKANVTLLDAKSILSGRQTSGVTITPAVRTLPPGLTISQSRTGLPLHTTNGGKPPPLPAGISVSSANTPGTFNTSAQAIPGQLDDPNLTDDTFVVEAPSFIVPYVYEKPPKETIKDFKSSIEKIREKEEQEKKAKEAEEKKMMDALPLNDEESAKRSKKNDQSKDVDEKIKEPKPEEPKKEEAVKEVKEEPQKKKPDNFFESSLGKFFFGLGMNLVQEHVQNDLLIEQQRRARKDKSASVMHAIMSLKANIEQSKEKNSFFHMDLKKCRFCSFRTESQAVLDHHMETPHMKGSNYR